MVAAALVQLLSTSFVAPPARLGSVKSARSVLAKVAPRMDEALASVDSFSNTVNFANLMDNRKLEGYGYDYYNYGRSPYYSYGGMYNNGYRGGYANQARGMGYGMGYYDSRDAMSRMYNRGYGYGGYGYGGYGMGYGNRAYVRHGRARTLQRRINPLHAARPRMLLRTHDTGTLRRLRRLRWLRHGLWPVPWRLREPRRSSNPF